MDDDRTMQAIRRTPRYPRPLTIVLSVKAMQSGREKCPDEGADCPRQAVALHQPSPSLRTQLHRRGGMPGAPDTRMMMASARP